MLKKISNYDIMNNDLDILFENNIKADVMYVDPPWGLSNLKYWRTLNNQRNYPVDWILFLKRLYYIYKKHSKTLYIETGIRFKNDLIDIFGKPSNIFLIKYESGKKWYPNLILVYDILFNECLTGKFGYDLVYSCLKNFKGKIVFDPCVGLGLTAKVANDLEMSILCNELNIKRVNRTAIKYNLEWV